MVIPEIGLDDEPITPVIRELTVTNRKPKKHDHRTADEPAGQIGGDQMRWRRSPAPARASRR